MLKKSEPIIISFLGFISGFTLMISGNTLNYWLAQEGVNLKVIGIFAFVSLPYAINFIWAPFFDSKELKLLSRYLEKRLAWIILIQIILAVFVLILSKIDLVTHLYLIAMVSFVISFLSSSQDALLGALRTEIIAKDAQGAASGIYILGYRLGMLSSSSGAIYLSVHTSWQNIYQIFAAIIFAFPFILYLAMNILNKENLVRQVNIISKNDDKHSSPLIQILFHLKKISGLIWIIAFLILYRLPDNFINVMINPFLLHLGYNALEIASVGKFFGVTNAIIGGLLASWIMRKYSILNCLLFFGILHAIAHSLFILQELEGKNISLLFIVIGFESITGGMTMSAYIAFISSLCYGKYRATQYSFYSAMMGVSRSILPSFSGYLVLEFGWKIFFISMSLVAVPSLFIISKLKNYSKKEQPVL